MCYSPSTNSCVSVDKALQGRRLNIQEIKCCEICFVASVTVLFNVVTSLVLDYSVEFDTSLHNHRLSKW